jgi:uncharacterized cupin superfamily protein
VRFTILLAFAIAIATPLASFASADSKAVAVLDQEQRWVKASANHDAAALGKILSENFVHINYRGTLTYREQELANVVKARAYAQTTSEQTVDFAATENVAVVHGLNTISEKGKVVLRLRYTDVYVNQRGRWMALSAQETAITP